MSSDSSLDYRFIKLGAYIASVVMSLMLSPLCFSATPKIVYGFDKAQHLSIKSKQVLYIQAGSFLSATKAQQYQKYLQSKTTAPITIAHKGSSHAVLVGPFFSSSALRKTALKLSSYMKFKLPIKNHQHQQKKWAKIQSKKPALKQFTKTLHIQEPAKFSVLPPIPIFPPRQTKLEAPITSQNNWFLAVAGGAQFPLQPANMTVDNGSGSPAPFNTDIYGTGKDSQALFALAGGHRWQREGFWWPSYSLGISWQYFFNTNVGNTITQYSDPTFINYNYTLNVSSNLVLAYAKLNLFQYRSFSPYINGGIGDAINHTNGYSETALGDVTPRVSPAFGNAATNSFAYQLGTGVDLQFTPRIMVSVGYNYQNLGQVASGQGTETWSGESLGFGRYNSNELLISLTYLFGK